MAIQGIVARWANLATPGIPAPTGNPVTLAIQAKVATVASPATLARVVFQATPAILGLGSLDTPVTQVRLASPDILVIQAWWARVATVGTPGSVDILEYPGTLVPPDPMVPLAIQALRARVDIPVFPAILASPATVVFLAIRA